MSLHCSMLSNHIVKATVLLAIRYFTGKKIGLLFRPINWQLMLQSNNYLAIFIISCGNM